MGHIRKSPKSVTSVYLSVHPLRSQFSLDFDETLHRSLESESKIKFVRGQNLITPSHYFTPIFHSCNAFSLMVRDTRLVLIDNL